MLLPTSININLSEENRILRDTEFDSNFLNKVGKGQKSTDLDKQENQCAGSGGK